MEVDVVVSVVVVGDVVEVVVVEFLPFLQTSDC